MKRFGISALLATLVLTGANAGDADIEHSDLWRHPYLDVEVLPFAEAAFADHGEKGAESSFWAFRPLFSTAYDVKSDSRVTDLLWPVSTFHTTAGHTWWRFLVFYGSRNPLADVYQPAPDINPEIFPDDVSRNSEWTFNIFPIWFSGRSRENELYCGLFPILGHHPHFLLMDDVHFALWPIYMDYAVKGVRSHAVLWPLISWKDDPRAAFGLWPFFGWYHQRESDHRYALWPLVTWAHYDEDRDTSGAGYSWMVLPFYGRVNRARESQHLFLPPFFSYAETDGAKRLRCPWPFVDLEKRTTRRRISVWPFWEQLEGYAYGTGETQERTWRLGWKLIERTSLFTDKFSEERFSVFPFWTDETRSVATKSGEKKEIGSYFRIWPFYSSEVGDDGVKRGKVFDLIPIRHSGGIERNWSPFWTFYSFEKKPDGVTCHNLLWSIIRFETGGESK